MMLLVRSAGLEYCLLNVGRRLLRPVFRRASTPGVVDSVLMPAGLGEVVVGYLLNNGPAMETLSLFTIVLSRIVAAKVSAREMPPPAHPATLFTIMLFWTVTLYKVPSLISSPLTPCRRIPPPLPASAKLPWIMLESMVTSPVPRVTPAVAPAGVSPSTTI